MILTDSNVTFDLQIVQTTPSVLRGGLKVWTLAATRTHSRLKAMTVVLISIAVCISCMCVYGN